MNEQHAGRAADCAAPMTTAADIIGEEYFAAAATVLFAVAGFDFKGAGKHDKKLAPGEMEGGVFTITNLGGIGGTFFSPIINAPQVAILGMARA